MSLRSYCAIKFCILDMAFSIAGISAHPATPGILRKLKQNRFLNLANHPFENFKPLYGFLKEARLHYSVSAYHRRKLKHRRWKCAWNYDRGPTGVIGAPVPTLLKFFSSVSFNWRWWPREGWRIDSKDWRWLLCWEAQTAWTESLPKRLVVLALKASYR